VLDDGRVRVEVDPGTGDIRSLTSSAPPGREFVRDGNGLNAYLYVAGRDHSKATRAGEGGVGSLRDAGPGV